MEVYEVMKQMFEYALLRKYSSMLHIQYVSMRQVLPDLFCDFFLKFCHVKPVNQATFHF